jgi:polyisoprenyl-teichoic acid--peptidoglycan teichoic acid transferase
MNRKMKAVLSICLVGIFLAGCNLPGSSVQSSLTNYDNTSHNLFVTADPHATATATPFQPAGESGTASTPTPSSGSSATALPATGPTAIPATPTTVPYSARYPKPDGQVNILILGSDFRPNAGYRTDTILLLSINTKKNTAALVSFPRDLYVDIPGWEMQRINTAQAHGGFELTQATFEENFGVKPDHYIMTNFQGFKSIIDALGGVNVYASKALSDKCDLPQKVKGYCNVGVGYNQMNGATALWYVRSRYSTSDYDRNRRQQEVIQAVFTKLLSLNALTRAPEIYNMFKSSVETDMSLADMLALLPVASQFTDLSNLKRYAVDTSLASGWITPEGADVQVPNLDKIFDTVIAKACYGQ